MMTTLDEYASKSLLRERLQIVQDLAWYQRSKFTLWIGAGFAKHYARLPLWSELLTELSREVEKADSELIRELIRGGRYAVAAELLTDIRSGDLSRHICELFATENFEPEANPLASISPGTLITTNYDLLLDALYPDYRILDPRQPIESIFSFAPKLVKIHGSVADPDHIVLNVTSYAKTYNKEFEWFLLHVFQSSVVLFVGTGLSASEPYIRYITLLKDAGLLPHHHFALLPFPWLGEDARTNRAIADRSNYLETLGIKVLPYVVREDSDHEFIDAFLGSLKPPNTNEAVDKQLKALDSELESFGPARIGPALFRSFRNMTDAQAEKIPFLNLVAKFLRAMREGRRVDLAVQWMEQYEALINHQEQQLRNKFNRTPGGTGYKDAEIARNKAFLFDVQRTLRPLKNRKGHGVF